VISIKQAQWPKIIAIIAMLSTVGIGTWYLYQKFQPAEQILDFNDARDTQDILDIFKRDWYWLVASDDYSPEFMLKYRAATQDMRYLGRLQIKVLRSKDGLIGFIAYYMKTPTEGFVLFLDINPPFRGKGYSEKLLSYALDNLKRLGATAVRLVTRTDNFPAQKLYQRTNFTEVSRDNGFVYFVKQF